MSESVEQAALRRAEIAELPAPWGSMLAALQALDRLGDARFANLTGRCDAHADTIAQLHDENAELRDSLLALSNRLEGLTRAFHSRTDHLA